MRTVDPQLFLDLCGTRAGDALGIEAQEGKWVQQLVSQRRVHSRLQAADLSESKP